MTREAFRDLYIQKIDTLRQETEQSFYFLNKEELALKPSAKGWSILEIFKHLNLTNHFYLQQAEQKQNAYAPASRDELALSWLGRWAVRQMEPNPEGKLRYKMKSPAMSHPQKGAQKEQALVADVIFRDFMDDLERLKKLLQLFPEKKVEKVKIQSLAPLIKMRLSDAIPFLITHAERHLRQAQGNLEQ